jgi:hypothetical protein
VVHAEITVVVSGWSRSRSCSSCRTRPSIDPRGLQTSRTIDDGRTTSSDAAVGRALEARLARWAITSSSVGRHAGPRLLELAVGDLVTLDAGREGR